MNLSIKQLFIIPLFLALGCSKDDSPQDQPKSSEKLITQFILTKTSNSGLPSDVYGTITADSIFIALPAGVSINNLVPTVTYKGKSINPASGTAQNFNSPVTYNVTAEDGTIKNYVVKVSTELKQSGTVLKKLIQYLSNRLEDSIVFTYDNQNRVVIMHHYDSLDFVPTVFKTTFFYNGNEKSPFKKTVHKGADLQEETLYSYDGANRRIYDSSNREVNKFHYSNDTIFSYQKNVSKQPFYVSYDTAILANNNISKSSYKIFRMDGTPRQIGNADFIYDNKTSPYAGLNVRNILQTFSTYAATSLVQPSTMKRMVHRIADWGMPPRFTTTEYAITYGVNNLPEKIEDGSRTYLFIYQ